jgi:hypothetical protein
MTCTTAYFLKLEQLIAEIFFSPFCRFSRSMAPVITRASFRAEQILCTGISVGIIQDNSDGTCTLGDTSLTSRIA